MKKVGTVSLAAMLVLSLVGCSGNAASSGNTTAASTEQSSGAQPVSITETTAGPGQDVKLGFSWWGNQTRNLTALSGTRCGKTYPIYIPGSALRLKRTSGRKRVMAHHFDRPGKL